MPDNTFRMLICGGSSSGKTNHLYHILMKPLVYYDQIHLYGKNLEQDKYQNMMKQFNQIVKMLVMMFWFAMMISYQLKI